TVLGVSPCSDGSVSVRVCSGSEDARVSGLLPLWVSSGPGLLRGPGAHWFRGATVSSLPHLLCYTCLPLRWTVALCWQRGAATSSGSGPVALPPSPLLQGKYTSGNRTRILLRQTLISLCLFTVMPARFTQNPSVLLAVVRPEPPEGPEENWDVIYKAPCGQSLRNFEDVMCFLSATESYDILQVDFFTFNHLVQLDPSPLPVKTQQDLSRGVEPTPVELCVGEGKSRPADFRYRKDRWPHGCFLSPGPTLFHTCCDCSDSCTDAEHCACVAMTTGGRGYRHHRLLEPARSGLAKHGFSWTGVVLQRPQSPTQASPAKLTRAELPSDDEVEVVTEWLAPPILEARGDLVETLPPPGSSPTSAMRHVPVIQRPSESSSTPQDQDKVLVRYSNTCLR
ncbi:hypothetical protein XENOCAPTIV_024640, partial [Xenoophorus captivus]